MKKILLFSLAAILLLSSCQQKKKEIEHAQLVNDSLTLLIVQKDSSLFMLVNTVSSIEANLQAIKEKEKIITRTAENGENIATKEEQINSDIQAIYNLLNDNKRKISQLKQQLRNSKVSEDQLKNTIASLNQRIVEKDAEIVELQQKLAEMNIEISSLNVKIEELNQLDTESKETIKVKDQTLQTAYFIIGTAKELKEMGIMDKGILIRKDLNKDFDKKHFTQINILKDTIINFNNKKVEILTVHPSKSYSMEGNELIESIKIKDPWEFWSVSKYLVVVVK